MDRKYQLKILSDSDVERIHHESLKILRELGVKFPHKGVLEALRTIGAGVDFDTEIVRFPEQVIEEVIALQRKNTDDYFRTHERLDENDYRQSFFMSGGNIRHVIDPKTFERRPAGLRDLVESIVVGNALSNVTRVSAFMIPHEYDPKLADIIQFYLLALYSRKRYFFTYIYSLDSAKCLIDMAREVAENEHQFTNGSLIEYELEPCGHLEFAGEHLEIAARFAANRMKIGTTHWSWMGMHTPMSYASLLSLTNAHILAGTAAVIALNPLNMYYRYIFPTHSVNAHDPSVPLMGHPNQVIFAWAARQLADYYGFKYCIANSGFSDALEDNFQSGFEVGVTAALAIASGITCLGVKGIIGVDQGVSLDRLVTDNELIDYLNFVFSRTIEVDEATLGFEAIKSLPRGGNFLESLKNREKTRELLWESDIFFSGKYENWRRDVSRERIAAKVAGILRDQFPPRQVLSSERAGKLKEVMRSHLKDKSVIDRLTAELTRLVG